MAACDNCKGVGKFIVRTEKKRVNSNTHEVIEEALIDVTEHDCRPCGGTGQVPD